MAIEYRSAGSAEQLTFRNLFPVLRQVFNEWSEDKATKMAAALAYYAIISIAPLLVVVLFVVGKIYHGPDAVKQLHQQMVNLTDVRIATAMDAIVPKLSNSNGNFASLVSLVVAVFGASGVFAELQDSLNTIWEVRPKPNRGIIAIIVDRFWSLAAVAGIAFLLLTTTILSSVVTALSTTIIHFLVHTDKESGKYFAQGALVFVDFCLSTAVISTLFAMMFKWLPDVKIRWKDVWFGALVTAVLFQVGKYGLSAYMKYASAGSAYGAAGSLVALLIWIFYAAQILFFGAEFTQVHANKFGSRIVPAANAEPLTEAMREQAGIAHSEDSPSHPDNREGIWRSEAARRRNRRLPLPITTPRKPPTPLAISAAPMLVGLVVGRFFFKRYRDTHRSPVPASERWQSAIHKWKRLGLMFASNHAKRYALSHGPEQLRQEAEEL